MRRISRQRVNGFIVLTGGRRLRKIRDYKIRKKPYKTKSGQIWFKDRYYRKGAYRRKPRGWVRYRKKK